MVFELALPPGERLDLLLERSQLARNVDRPRVQGLVGLRRLLAHQRDFVLEALLVAAQLVALRLRLRGPLLQRLQGRLHRGQLGALR